jgi:CheY-like chemotaxis protein
MEIRKALVVDDSKLAAVTLGRLLAKKSIQVISAGSGEEAIERLRSDRPDIIFMDFMMPGMDGYRTTQIISTNPATARIPVVMCTSQDTPEDRDKATGSGAKGFLTKPVSEESLDFVLDDVRQTLRMPEAAPETAPGAEAPPLAAVEAITEEELELAESTARAIAEQVASQVAESVARSVSERVVEEAVRTIAQRVTQEIVNAAGQKMLTEVLRAAREVLRKDLELQTGQVLHEECAKFVHSDEVKHVVTTLVQQNTASVAEPLIKKLASEVAEGVAQRAARLAAEETANSVVARASQNAAGSLKVATAVLGGVLGLVVLYLLFEIWMRFSS